MALIIKKTILTFGDAANDNGSGGASSAALYFLHADHLGRPKLATDADGAVVWDGGLNTPFGQGLSTMGALTQKLIFVFDMQPYNENGTTPYDPSKTGPIVDVPVCGCVSAP